MRHHSGIGRYVTELYARLPKHLPRAEFVMFGEPPRPGPGRFSFTRVWSPIYGLREQVELPLRAAGRGLRLFHSPHYNAPLAVTAPLVVTVHDLIHIMFPEYLPHPRWLARAYARTQLKLACRRARVVLTPSACTRRDMSRILGVDPRKVRVTPLGVDKAFAPVPEAGKLASFRRRHGLGEGYVLFVGNMKPHKNLERLVRAFAALGKPEYKLVLAGTEDPRYGGVRRAVADQRLGRRVVFLGIASPAELRMLYAAARVLALPSLYEGFGLPPLEAMACGTPVVASQAASLPEVVGEAALLVDPLDEDALARALRAAVEREPLRRRLRKLGLERARRYSWNETARVTAEALEEATEGLAS